MIAASKKRTDYLQQLERKEKCLFLTPYAITSNYAARITFADLNRHFKVINNEK